jgi:hypothetical protein
MRSQLAAAIAAVSALTTAGATPMGSTPGGATTVICASASVANCVRRSGPRDGHASIDRLGQPTPILPDSAMTPGAVLDVTDGDVCTPGYASRIRHVTAEMKRAIYAAYGITAHQPGDYEIDHLISLELGGSNARQNLWPQSYHTQPWNARVKDGLENRLHRMVCAHMISLKAAQDAIASDWIVAYQTYMPRRRHETGN